MVAVGGGAAEGGGAMRVGVACVSIGVAVDMVNGVTGVCCTEADGAGRAGAGGGAAANVDATDGVAGTVVFAKPVSVLGYIP